MQKKDVDYDQIYDVRATRVLVNEVHECYGALGVVHTLWQYVPGEFDDYIATPKGNNYQSLHTAVIGPEGKHVEVQIRTYDMHRHAEFGVAAHWRYKEGGKQEAGFERKIAWLRQLMEWKDEVRDAGEFVDNVQTDLFEDRVYVFTPKGQVIDLPQGSTPLDFAYHIHTEVGHRCRGAKVNGRMVSLTYPLKTGEQVEVLTFKHGEPSRDWLNPHLGYLHSSKARQKVQHWFKHQNYEKNVSAGRAALERELQRLGYTDVSYEELARHFNFQKVDDLMAAIGRNDVRTAQLVTVAQRMMEPPAKEQDAIYLNRPRQSSQPGEDVQILGVGNLLTHFAQCCKPVPGDPIRGFITRGRGVTIHREDCTNILRYNNQCPERLIEVHWGQRTENSYPVEIQVTAYDRPGLLKDISSVLANDSINVLAANVTSNKRSNLATILLTAELGDIERLSRILAKISQLPNVVDTRRKQQ